jgi:hypothetical protein
MHNESAARPRPSQPRCSSLNPMQQSYNAQTAIIRIFLYLHKSYFQCLTYYTLNRFMPVFICIVSIIVYCLQFSGRFYLRGLEFYTARTLIF